MTVNFLVVFHEISWKCKIWKHEGRFYTFWHGKIVSYQKQCWVWTIWTNLSCVFV